MAVPSFLIKNGSLDFVNKQKNLFDSLDLEEKKKNMILTPSTEIMDIDENKSYRRQRNKTKHFRGKESLFKEPVELPLRFKRINRIPDFQRNPHKWVKYSLADITQDDMSNESNTAAAMSFLRDIEIQKNKVKAKIKVEEKDEEEEEGLKIKYKKPNLHQFDLASKSNDSKFQEPISNVKKESTRPVFKSSKLIMPEYVVGQVKKETRQRQKLSSEKSKSSSKEVFLNHIHEYEDE